MSIKNKKSKICALILSGSILLSGQLVYASNNTRSNLQKRQRNLNQIENRIKNEEQNINSYQNQIKSIENIVVGDQVLSVDGTFKDVVKTFIYEKPTIKFTFEGGKTIECSEDHKFLVGEDPTVEENWKAAKDLNENDFVYEIVSGGI